MTVTGSTLAEAATAVDPRGTAARHPPPVRSGKRRVALRSLGCRTNQEEIESLRAELRAAGFCLVDDTASADIVIVNTCTVTAHAEAKARRLIQCLSRANPRVRVLATGCLAQQSPDLGTHWVVGNRHKADIARILAHDSAAVVHSPWDTSVRDALRVPEIVPDPRDGGRTRFSIKIQEGCDFSCAYCIVPSVRGHSRSAPRDRVRETFARALEKGYREIVVTGTHIGQYQDRGAGLAALLFDLVGLDGDYRVRLSSLDPRDLTADLCDIIAASPRVCDHLHLSLQSLCDGVLGPMNRSSWSVERILDAIQSLQRRRPNLIVGADIIVGFPGETDEMFAVTLANVEAANLGYGHVFRYSPRPGTVSASLPGQVPESEKTRRGEALRAALDAQRRTILARLVGTCQRVLVEQEHPTCGFTSNYVRACLPGVRVARNSLVDVKIVGWAPEPNRREAEWYASIMSSPEGGKDPWKTRKIEANAISG